MAQVIPGLGPSHTMLIRPGIRFVTTATISDGTLNLSALGLQAGDFIRMSNGRTNASAPTPAGAGAAADWSEIRAAFLSATPCYRTWWWGYYRPGMGDPLPGENGRKRLVAYRGARLKTVLPLLSSGTSTTAGHVPAAAPVVPVNREVAVVDIYCRNAQAAMAGYLPAWATQRFAANNSVNNEIGGDSIAANGALGAGGAQFDPTFTATTPFAALAFILEPRNS